MDYYTSETVNRLIGNKVSQLKNCPSFNLKTYVTLWKAVTTPLETDTQRESYLTEMGIFYKD